MKKVKARVSLVVAVFLATFQLNANAATLTPISGPHIKINIVNATNFNSDDLVKLEKARHMIELVLNSEEFKQGVLNFSYNGVKTFVQNNGMSNQQIYDYLMLGSEMYPNQTVIDHEMDVELALYRPKWYQSKKVVGYTDQSYATIFMNQYYFRPARVSDVADNMVHEWTHKMGFDHDYKSTARRPSSVPYAIGYMVDDIIAAVGGNN